MTAKIFIDTDEIKDFIREIVRKKYNMDMVVVRATLSPENSLKGFTVETKELDKENNKEMI